MQYDQYGHEELRLQSGDLDVSVSSPLAKVILMKSPKSLAKRF